MLAKRDVLRLSKNISNNIVCNDIKTKRTIVFNKCCETLYHVWGVDLETALNHTEYCIDIVLPLETE